MDSEGLGAPDVSCHGVEPWNARFSYYSRELGVLFFGGYYGGNSLYFAFNFHWEPHVFYLPEIEKIKNGNGYLILQILWKWQWMERNMSWRHAQLLFLRMYRLKKLPGLPIRRKSRQKGIKMPKDCGFPRLDRTSPKNNVCQT